MLKSFSRFLEAIHLYPDGIRQGQLEDFLEASDAEALKEIGILKRGSDLTEMLCRSCDEDHFVEVRIKEGKLYCVCSHSDCQPSPVYPEEVAVWLFDVEAFLRVMAPKFGIEDGVEKMGIEGMWQVGSFSREETHHACYYYQGQDFANALAFIGKQRSQMRRYVLLTNRTGTSTTQLEGHAVLFIETKDLAGLKSGKLTFNKKAFDESLVHGFRSVIFDPTNGDLIANGRRIATVTPASTEYYFVKLLWQHFNEPVSHEKMARYIYEKTKKEYSESFGKLANKQKDKAKKASTDPALIDKIFDTTRDQDGKNAYIMRNPG